MRRLLGFLPSRRALLWSAVALMLGPVAILALVLLIALAPGVELTIDVSMVLLAVAVVVVTLTGFHAVRHFLRPRRAVAVNYNFKLDQPALPMGRYTFRLEVFYELEERGEQQRLEQGRIEMRFRRSDHPEIFEWCRSQVIAQLERHGLAARERFPDARILVSPEPDEAQFFEGLDQTQVVRREALRAARGKTA